MGALARPAGFGLSLERGEAIHTALCASQQTKSLYTLRFPIVPFILFCDVLSFISALSNLPQLFRNIDIILTHFFSTFVALFLVSFKCIWYTEGYCVRCSHTSHLKSKEFSQCAKT